MGGRDKNIKKFRERKQKRKTAKRYENNCESYHRFVLTHDKAHPDNYGLLSYACWEYDSSMPEKVGHKFDWFLDYFNHYVYAPKKEAKTRYGQFWYKGSHPKIIETMKRFGDFLKKEFDADWSHITTKSMDGVFYEDYVQVMGHCSRRKWEVA